jgi:hypothetical protein
MILTNEIIDTLIKLKLLLSSDLFRYPVDILRLFNYKGLKIIWLSNRSILSVSDECFVKKRTEWTYNNNKCFSVNQDAHIYRAL